MSVPQGWTFDSTASRNILLPGFLVPTSDTFVGHIFKNYYLLMGLNKNLPKNYKKAPLLLPWWCRQSRHRDPTFQDQISPLDTITLQTVRQARKMRNLKTLGVLVCALLILTKVNARHRKGSFQKELSPVHRHNRRKRQRKETTTITTLRGGSSRQSITNFRHRIRSLVTRRNDNHSNTPKVRVAYNPLSMYLTCMAIVSVWIASGTLFYSYCNDWPLAQSFFYAVDAGMSIGFCTDVHEVKLVSKAFTIVYILLGASVTGGALALFIQDAVEGLSTPAVQEYQVLLEKEVFRKADVDRTGVLTYTKFQALIRSSGMEDISDDDVQRLWTKFGRLKDGVIHFEEFVGTYRGIEQLVQSLKKQQKSMNLNPLWRLTTQLRIWLQQAWQLENRIYFVFMLWVSIGIMWGILNQHWDPITATHFAVSALATGGLTAPDVNPDGILPAQPAIFCGVFCLLGIPLFALTLGHFARVLVSGHVAAMEASALTRPLSRAEFDLAKHLTTRDSVVHLSDFVVLQLLRQGKLSLEAIEVLKQNFEMLDSDRSGTLTLKQATSVLRLNKHCE
jgi:Ca2+-binding EF-hand superfamily protein